MPHSSSSSSSSLTPSAVSPHHHDVSSITTQSNSNYQPNTEEISLELNDDEFFPGNNINDEHRDNFPATHAAPTSNPDEIALDLDD